MSPPPSNSGSYTSPFTHNNVTGNASENVKKLVDGTIHIPTRAPEIKPRLFASGIMDNLVLTEVNIGSMTEEPSRLEGKVVVKIVVNEEMLNLADTVHGGAIAFFVDFCSSLALMALDASVTGESKLSVSQAMNVVFHSPAALGETIRIVNKSVSSGGRAATGRTEIWNEDHHRLVASGMHIKMLPSKVKTKL